MLALDQAWAQILSWKQSPDVLALDQDWAQILSSKQSPELLARDQESEATNPELKIEPEGARLTVDQESAHKSWPQNRMLSCCLDQDSEDQIPSSKYCTVESGNASLGKWNSNPEHT